MPPRRIAVRLRFYSFSVFRDTTAVHGKDYVFAMPVCPILKILCPTARVACPPFGIMLWQRRGNYTPYIVIARLGKADYLESLRQISSLVIARLRKAEAIQYKLLNHYINAFIRKNYQTGLLRSARNDAGGGETGFSGQAQK